MGSFVKLLRTLLPIAEAAASATPNKIDDALIALVKEILDKLPADEAAALARLTALKNFHGMQP